MREIEKFFPEFDIFTPIYTMPDDLLLSSKLCAAIERQKGRDFMDVVNLLEFVKPNFKYLNDKLGIETPKSLKELLLETTNDIDFESKMRIAAIWFGMKQN